MNSVTEKLFTDLRALIADLGKDGGLISASVYDTAQLLRFYPPAEGVGPALEWILAQQQGDGGWGRSPTVPYTRDIPTLAAILALHTYRPDDKAVREAVTAGISFLRGQAEQWRGSLPDGLPVGAELILPKLLEDAATLGLDVPRQQYKVLISMHHRKRQYISRVKPGAGTPPLFSWEAWGTKPEPELLDRTGGVGHSPAATAYWLYLAKGRPELEDASKAARQYLVQAAKVTGLDIPGVVPTAWPIDRYEQAFVLHIFAMVDLLKHPVVWNVVQPQLQDLASAIQVNGLGFSDFFIPDMDDTGAALATLKTAGYDVSFESISYFLGDNHFITYPDEFHSSRSAMARGLHAMSLYDKDIAGLQRTIIAAQLGDGRWPGDKWNFSWLYVTFLVSYALTLSGFHEYSQATLQSTIDTLQTSQHPDGGWGINGKPAVTDTFYAALTLYTLRDYGNVYVSVLQKAHQWLLRNYQSFKLHKDHRWLNKQEYSPYRIDWAFELSALLALSLDPSLQEEKIHNGR